MLAELEPADENVRRDRKILATMGKAAKPGQGTSGPSSGWSMPGGAGTMVSGPATQAPAPMGPNSQRNRGNRVRRKEQKAQSARRSPPRQSSAPSPYSSGHLNTGRQGGYGNGR